MYYYNMALRDLFNKTDDGRFISYAQCAEDVLISRFFEGKTLGTYVDVGANHPCNDSVTKNLYDAGWRGVNIEPVPSFFKKLLDERTEDLNLQIGISSIDSVATLYKVNSNLDWSTFDETRAKELEGLGNDIERVSIEVKTLDSVLIENNFPSTIELLKIDAESHEMQVLRGIDFQRVSFELIVIEVSDSREEIVDYLSKYEYKEKHFDGLNSWLSRSEIDAEKVFLPAPTPVLDWYHPWVYISQLNQQHALILSLIEGNSNDEPNVVHNPQKKLKNPLRTRRAKNRK